MGEEICGNIGGRYAAIMNYNIQKRDFLAITSSWLWVTQ